MDDRVALWCLLDALQRLVDGIQKPLCSRRRSLPVPVEGCSDLDPCRLANTEPHLPQLFLEMVANLCPSLAIIGRGVGLGLAAIQLSRQRWGHRGR